jgi:hypothetical protein
MDAVQAKIGDVDFLFQVSDNIDLKNMSTESQMPVPSGQTGGGATGNVVTLTAEGVSDLVLDKITKVIYRIADKIINSEEKINNPPDEMEIEFSLLLGTEGKIVVVSGKAEATIGVRMKWNK